MKTSSDRIHVWEAAGLGKAPYKFLGMTEEKFQAVPGDPSCPIQPGTSCDYCPMAIMNAFWFRSADGKEFKVGCDCFYKSNSDKALERQVDSAKREHERKLSDARKARAAARITEEFAALLTELDGWTEGFAGEFGRSVARQIRKGKKPTPKQLACIERLRAEAAA